jgi:hypothetical protein
MRRSSVVRVAGVMLLSFVALVLVSAAMAAGSGQAKNATLQQYGNEQVTPIPGAQAPGGNGAGVLGAQAKAVLPFTGVQLTIFVLGGIVLVASGLVLRSTARGRPPHS